MVSTGQGVVTWTAGQCLSPQGWDFPAVEAKSLDANDNVYALAA